ncbi:MAG TPA: biotin--[acetyl-CoA-carboxylase] ligase [Acidimicrobiales bacterium]|nr:biotin--[acetyl-CoA-carboxylase] ligase [Acidimicrobiales bacterium]
MSAGTRFSEVRRFAELDSTNRYLLDEARAGASDGLVVVADHQTAGRGRLGRRWEAPPGANLLLSVLLRPDLRPEELHLSTVAMALAARLASAEATGLEITLKWPNDLMVGERKTAGILAETLLQPPGPPGGAEPAVVAVVVGIGLNLAWPPPDGAAGSVPLPEGLGPATSLWRESGTRVEPGVLLDRLLAHLEPLVDDLSDPAGRRRLASDYRRACTTLGRLVRVSLEGETVTGTVLDITGEGHLLLDVGACVRTIPAGDVVHLRG